MSPNPRRAPLLACLPLALAACGATPASVAEMRVLVKLAQPQNDPAVIASLAAQVSGHAARYVAPGGGGWHALALTCGSPDDCDTALRRLAEDGTRFAAAQRDARKALVTP